jgi:hypothetical protein
MQGPRVGLHLMPIQLPLSFDAAVAAGGASTEEALAIFDALAPVPADLLRGAWAGTGFPTGHPMDGALEAYHWHGKRFEGEEDVHPLVFRSGGRKLALHPSLVAPFLPLVLRFPCLKSPALGRLLQPLLPLLATRRSRARLRMTQHRGQLTATMIYDGVPIQDVFRQVDAGTLLGLMDMKGMQQPFFFVLRRERE